MLFMIEVISITPFILALIKKVARPITPIIESLRINVSIFGVVNILDR